MENHRFKTMTRKDDLDIGKQEQNDGEKGRIKEKITSKMEQKRVKHY